VSLARLIGRVLLAAIGFLFACLAAGFVMMAAIGHPGLIADVPADTPLQPINQASAVILTSMITARMAFLPAMIAIVLGEILSARSVVAHLAAGMVVIVAGLSVPWPDPTTVPLDTPQAWTMTLAAGAVAGFVYWIIAGRGAGIAPRR